MYLVVTCALSGAPPIYRAVYYVPDQAAQPSPSGLTEGLPGLFYSTLEATDVSNSGSNYVYATVPAGATTGPITITTPGGTVTTTAKFTVQ
jgi:hypothetical protein